MEDYAHIESALNAVFDHIEASGGNEDECHSDFKKSLHGGYDDAPEDRTITDLYEGYSTSFTFSTPSAGAKWSSPVMTTEVLKKPMRKSSIGHGPHSPYRSAHSRSAHSSCRK